MNLTPEEKTIGRDNYYDAIGFTRRDFLLGGLAAGVTSGAGLGAMYFGYGSSVGDPVRVGVIGTGDEGNVLIGAINPEYVQVTAICDIRPSSIYRAFHGDWASATAISVRQGLMSVYDWKTEEEARKHVQVYEDYRELLKDSTIEAVIIALPLHLHAEAAIAAMKAGKHVLTEKLMGHNVAQCKLMSQVSQEKELYLTTGHQRHYSVLYDNAVNLIQWDLLGEIHHIRAQWHRGNLPGKDSWKQPLPGGEIAHWDDPRNRYRKGDKFDEIAWQFKDYSNKAKKEKDPKKRELYARRAAQWEAWVKDKDVNAEDYGYVAETLTNGYQRSALEELVRWRLWNRTGGGLMAELGSHQLDAASIFISALRKDGKKAHPLTVHAVGGRHIFPQDREADDHVYCLFEFPGPGYEADYDVGYKDAFTGYPDPQKGIPTYDIDKNKKIVVSYSSINGNGFGGYGEVVMGSKGTLILEREQEVMLYKGSSTSTKVGVKQDGGGAVLDTQASGDTAAVAQAAETTGPVSRGYAEEIEHWAWCIRNADPENLPRCHPKVALGDAVIALTARQASVNSAQGKTGFIAFEESWFDIDDPATPDGSDINEERQRLDA